MAFVYVLYSAIGDCFYIGYTKDMEQRIEYHNKKEFKNSFTSKYSDWTVYWKVSDIEVATARKIEAHIKKMKSRKYIEDIKKYPDIIKKLKEKYS